MKDICVEFWGDFACFAPPYAKVERLTYPAPTPTAMIGMLSAIYSKPLEFHWEIKKIEILKPISYISFRRNELTCVATNLEPCYANEKHTQRLTVALKDVRYRVTATIVPRGISDHATPQGIYDQAIRRLEKGQCFYQPYMGMREFMAYFELSDGSRKPVSTINADMGYVVHDLWDMNEWRRLKKCKPKRTLFHCEIKNGVIDVPSRNNRKNVIRLEE